MLWRARRALGVPVLLTLLSAGLAVWVQEDGTFRKKQLATAGGLRAVEVRKGAAVRVDVASSGGVGDRDVERLGQGAVRRAGGGREPRDHPPAGKRAGEWRWDSYVFVPKKAGEEQVNALWVTRDGTYFFQRLLFRVRA